MITESNQQIESAERNAYIDGMILTLIICLGGLLRFIGLGWESLWFDEACSLDMVSASVDDIVSGRALTPGNPFGYFAILRLWCEQFGFNIESARAMSALFGTLVVPATWLSASRITRDRHVSMAAAFLVAVSPPMVFLSREARVYPILALLAVLATMYASEIIRSQSIHGWIGLTITCSLLPHFHYYSSFFLFVIGLLVLWFSREKFWATLGRLLILYAIVGIAFLPGLSLFLTQLQIMQEVAVNSLMQVLSFPIFVLGDRTFVWKQDGTLLLLIGECLAVFGVWLPVFWQIRKDSRAPWLVLATGGGVLIVAIAVSGLYMSMFNARYVSFIVPLLLIVVAYAMSQMVRTKQRGFAIPIALLGIITSVSLMRMYTEVQKDDWRSLSQYIDAHGSNVPVVFYEDIGATTFKYFRPQQKSIQLFEPFDPDGQAWNRAGYSKLLSSLSDYWLVVTPIWTDEVPEQISTWCSQFGNIVDAKAFKGLHLIRLTSNKAAANAAELSSRATTTPQTSPSN